MSEFTNKFTNKLTNKHMTTTAVNVVVAALGLAIVAGLGGCGSASLSASPDLADPVRTIPPPASAVVIDAHVGADGVGLADDPSRSDGALESPGGVAAPPVVLAAPLSFAPSYLSPSSPADPVPTPSSIAPAALLTVPTTTPPTTAPPTTIPAAPPPTTSLPPATSLPPVTTAPPTTAAPAPVPSTIPSSWLPTDSKAAADFAADINQLRSGLGLGTLTRTAELDSLAMGWAQTMADTGQLNHSTIIHGLVNSSWTRAAENIGYGPDEPVVFSALVASNGHYNNMVNPNYTHVGTAVVIAGNTIWTVHLFAG